MRNSRRKTLRNSIRKLTLKPNDFLLTNLPEELIKYLSDHLRDNHSELNLTLINLVNDYSIEQLDEYQLLLMQTRINKALDIEVKWTDDDMKRAAISGYHNSIYDKESSNVWLEKYKAGNE
jgi:hypothetical protein